MLLLIRRVLNAFRPTQRQMRMEVSIPLEDELKALAPWLFDDWKAVVTRSVYVPEQFGNSAAVLDFPKLTLVFIRDRGQTSLEVSSSLDTSWRWSIDTVHEFLEGKEFSLGSELTEILEYLRPRKAALFRSMGEEYESAKPELERIFAAQKRRFLQKTGLPPEAEVLFPRRP